MQGLRRLVVSIAQLYASAHPHRTSDLFHVYHGTGLASLAILPNVSAAVRQIPAACSRIEGLGGNCLQSDLCSAKLRRKSVGVRGLVAAAAQMAFARSYAEPLE